MVVPEVNIMRFQYVLFLALTDGFRISAGMQHPKNNNPFLFFFHYIKDSYGKRFTKDCRSSLYFRW